MIVGVAHVDGWKVDVARACEATRGRIHRPCLGVDGAKDRCNHLIIVGHDVRVFGG